MAAALVLAGWKHRDEPYWNSWALANVVLGAALGVFILEKELPPLLTAILPNGLLVLGMGLRWRAAREFSGRTVPEWLVWAPVALFLAAAVPFAHGTYGAVFTIVNILLCLQSVAIGLEFWRDRGDGLPSRYGLVAAYGLMAASFGWRVLLGIADAGAMPVGLPHDDALTIHLIVAVAHTVASGAFALSLAHERTNAQLSHAATHDALTGLLNRGAFESLLKRLCGRQPQRPFALALLDIDHFKRINDRFGHAAGDEALRLCAETCRAHVREGDAVARIGGEEFAVLLDDIGHDEACAIVERLRLAVAACGVSFAGSRFRVTLSGGVCHSGRAPPDFEAMLRLADSGLYEAKNKGRNRIEKMAA